MIADMAPIAQLHPAAQVLFILAAAVVICFCAWVVLQIIKHT